MTILDTLLVCLNAAPASVSEIDRERAKTWVLELITVRQVPVPEVNDREFSGCHLELRLLDADEVCGACHVAAGEHRRHPSNASRV